MTVFTQNKSYNRSNQYKVVSSGQVVETLQKEGFQLTDTQLSRVRNTKKEGFQKHLLRFSREDYNINIQGLRPEVIVINSYDGSSSFRILLGLFRFACCNGLIVGNSFEEFRVRHIGQDCLSEVLQSIESVRKNIPILESQVNRFSSIQLSIPQQVSFAQQVSKQLVPQDNNILDVYSADLLRIRRKEDHNTDLFTILNIIQENSLDGNIGILRKTDSGIKEAKLRRINSLDRKKEVNQLIWNIAESYAA